MVNLQMLQVLTTNPGIRVCVAAPVTGQYIQIDRKVFVSRLKGGYYTFPLRFNIVMGDTMYLD